MTVQQFGNTYAGNSTYGNQLAQVLGVDPSTPLAAVANSNASGSGIGASIDAAGNLITGKSASSDFSLFGWDAPRVVVLIIGIVLFIAGLFAFKQTQVLIQGVGRHAGRIAELGAA